MAENTKTATVQSKDDEISLRELILNMQQWFRYLLSKWYIILIFGLLGAAIGYWYAAAKKPVYTATTTFVLESGEGGGGLGQYAGLASMIGIDVGGGGGIFQGDNIIELYKSRAMIERTLLSPTVEYANNELLIHRYIDLNKFREKWKKKPELRNIHFTADNKYSTSRQQLLHDSIMGAVVKDINNNYLKVVKPDKKLSIIKVDLRAKDELFAKAFNEQLVARVNDFYVTTKTKKSLENVAILQGKVDSVRGVMTGAIYRAAHVVDATPNLNPTRQALRVVPVQNAQVSADVNKAILAELLRNLELSKVSLSMETPLIQIVDEPILPLEKENLGNLTGLVTGSFIGVFLIVLILLIRKIFQNTIKEPLPVKQI